MYEINANATIKPRLTACPQTQQTNTPKKAYLFNEQKKRDHEIALSDLISNGLSDLKVQDEVVNGNLTPGLLQLSNNVRITVSVCVCVSVRALSMSTIHVYVMCVFEHQNHNQKSSNNR